MAYNWQRLNRDAFLDMLERIKVPGYAGLFSVSTSEAQYCELPFYSHVRLYKLVNYAALPMFEMYFLGDDTHFLHLNGSQDILYKLNEQGFLHLNRGNILDYLEFFFAFTTHEDGDIAMISSVEGSPLLDSLDIEYQQDIIAHHRQAEIEMESDNSCFHVFSTLINGGSLVAGDIRVDTAGHVEIVDTHMLLSTSIPRDVVSGVI